MVEEDDEELREYIAAQYVQNLIEATAPSSETLMEVLVREYIQELILES